MSLQVLELYTGATAAAKDYAFGTFYGQGLFGAHRDKISFYFGGKAKGKAEDFGINGIIKGIAFFGGVDVYPFFQAHSHYGHYVCEGTAEAGDLGYNHCVSFFHFGEGLAQLALPLVYFAAYGLLYPSVNDKSFFQGKFSDFFFLIVGVLFPSADS